MSTSDIVFFRNNIVNTYLVSFGNNLQCIELEFNNSQYDEIKMFLDCRISISNPRIEKLVKPLKSFSEDIYTLAYFIVVNNNEVTDCFFENESLHLKFENSIQIDFIFDRPESEIGVSFKEGYHDTEYVHFKLDRESLKTIIT